MSKKYEIDNLDRQILSLLTNDARISYLEVARKCNVSGASIHQRINRLYRIGVIKKSEFILNPQKMGFSTCAFMGIYLEKANLYKQAVEALRQIPQVVECHYTTGAYSIFIKVYARDNDHLRTVISDKLQAISGITRTETFISLEESFKRQIPLE